MTLDLDSVLDSVLPATQAREIAWKPFGFLRNPFPSRSHPIWDVFYNQEAVRDRFFTDLGEFLKESNTVTLFFTGGNRVGKTHFMEHHKQELTSKLRERGVVVPMAIVSSQFCDFRTIYGLIIDQLDESLLVQTGQRLFEGSLTSSVASRLGQLPVGDFRRAVERAVDPGTDEIRDEVRVLLRRWLRGDRIRAPQRALLNVTSLVDSTSQMLNALEGLVSFLLLAYEVGEQTGMPHCAGFLIFIDEFELVWRARRDRRDQFLQSLRAMIDACRKGLFLVIGMATGLDVDVEQVESSYPALFQRLRGMRELPALLQIQFFSDAIGYARAFIDHARKEFEDLHGKVSVQEIFSNQEIESFFRDIGRGGTISQGDFFDRLHNEAEQRARQRATLASGSAEA